MDSNPIENFKTNNIITFYHDIEQDFDSEANPETCRRIVKKFLEIEKRHGVSATYNVIGKLYRQQPDLIDWIKNSGGELSFHSFNHQSDWKSAYYIQEIDLCRNISPTVIGYRSPRSRIDKAAIRHLWQKGFKWTAEDDYYNPEPYFIHKGLVRLPITDDDWDMHSGYITIDRWLEKFSKYIIERPYTAIGFHDSTTALAQDDRLYAWEKAIQMAAERGMFILTFSETTDLFRRASLLKFYNDEAAIWNRINKGFYRTVRFREMIQNEVEQIPNPVIADLGSGGGLLSSHLKCYAKKIYCIDNAENMIADLSSGVFETRVGEVTDTGLEGKSIDFVICGRLIEYMLRTDQLANEIKRIGKKGATYFVTFPAFRGTVSNGAETPNRIRHYFTPDEIFHWASEIGPGKLYGIQYEKTEPKDSEEEERLRAMEKNPSRDAIPYNWVWIGKIEKDYNPKCYQATIPANRVIFKLTKKRYGWLKWLIRKTGSVFPKNLKDKMKRLLLRF